MGRGKAFDPSRFFIFCANVMGSPYGSFSPVRRSSPPCLLVREADDAADPHSNPRRSRRTPRRESPGDPNVH